MAAEALRAANLPRTELAVGTRGILNYSHILIGDPTPEDALSGIKRRLGTTDAEALYPFFANISVTSGTPASEASKVAEPPPAPSGKP